MPDFILDGEDSVDIEGCMPTQCGRSLGGQDA